MDRLQAIYVRLSYTGTSDISDQDQLESLEIFDANRALDYELILAMRHTMIRYEEHFRQNTKIQECKVIIIHSDILLSLPVDKGRSTSDTLHYVHLRDS